MCGKLPTLVAVEGLGECEPRGSEHLTCWSNRRWQPNLLNPWPREAAKALGISARTLWGLTAPRGPVPCLRIGHGKRQTVLYPVADLQAWLSRQAEVEKGADDAK